MVCWGATTVHTHLPSLSWAELYTCHDSSGLAGKTCERGERKRKVILPVIQHLKVIVSFIIPYSLALQTLDTRLHKTPSAHATSDQTTPISTPTNQNAAALHLLPGRHTSVSFTHTQFYGCIWLTAVILSRSAVPFLNLCYRSRSDQCVWSCESEEQMEDWWTSAHAGLESPKSPNQWCTYGILPHCK